MFVRELEIDKNVILAKAFYDDDEICNPVYCLPDAYNLCDPDMDEDGGCDPHYD